MQRSFNDNLRLYAELAVRHGVNIQPNQELLVSADVTDAPLARLVAAEAYRAGAKNVQVLYSDDATALTRYKLGSPAAMEYVPNWFFDGVTDAVTNNAARLVIFGSDPALLKDIDPSKVAAYSQLLGRATERLAKLIGGFQVNWSIVGSAAPEWAQMVFPGQSAEDAVRNLWDAIFAVSRIDKDAPLAAWKTHQDETAARAKLLTELKLDAVHFRGPGTDLKVGLAESTHWLGGWCTAANGVTCSPNIPTEEVFSVPHRDRVEGFVSSTKPLSLRGQVLDGIRLEFSGGEAVQASAKVGEDALLKLLQTDAGAKRLGEVALVPASSPVSRTGLLFYNTLYDENAACHIALGRAIGACFANNSSLSENDIQEKGGNSSIVHVDWMIGSEHIDVDGIRSDGSTIALLRQGEWMELA